MSEQFLLHYYYCDSWKIFAMKLKLSDYTTPYHTLQHHATPICECAVSFEAKIPSMHLPNFAVWSKGVFFFQTTRFLFVYSDR